MLGWGGGTAFLPKDKEGKKCHKEEMAWKVSHKGKEDTCHLVKEGPRLPTRLEKEPLPCRANVKDHQPLILSPALLHLHVLHHLHSLPWTH